MTVDLSDVINDDDLADDYQVERSTGKFVAGGWQTTSVKNLDFWGVITIAKGKDLDPLPEGDRINAAIVFFSTKEIFLTRMADGTVPGGTSDIIIWQGDRYRVATSQNYSNRGFWTGVAVRTKGA